MTVHFLIPGGQHPQSAPPSDHVAAIALALRDRQAPSPDRLPLSRHRGDQSVADPTLSADHVTPWRAAGIEDGLRVFSLDGH